MYDLTRPFVLVVILLESRCDCQICLSQLFDMADLGLELEEEAHSKASVDLACITFSHYLPY